MRGVLADSLRALRPEVCGESPREVQRCTAKKDVSRMFFLLSAFPRHQIGGWGSPLEGFGPDNLLRSQDPEGAETKQTGR